MPITANYSSASFTLTVVGTTAFDTITLERTAAGALLVNGGAVSITGGSPTVANTDLIAASGSDGDDTITIDEANGPMPRAELSGGLGNDVLTGGSGGDTLTGDANSDTLSGRGGNDQLYGGGENDVLTGGDGDDQMFGGAGNDRMIWNPGDDTDLMEGGTETDTAEVNGGNGDEVFTITANGARVRFDRVSPAPFALDIGTTENLVLNANGGNDSISVTGNLAALISLTIDGGAGNDTILGGNGADTLIGGDDDDFVDGQQGNDTALLGAGNDTFQWDPGDGSDVVEGQGGNDLLLFNGSGANEIFSFSANGGRALFTRNVGNIVMDVNDVESQTLNALGGADGINVYDMSGTDLTQITINLAGTIGGSTGDSQIDTVTVIGTVASNTITVSGSAGTVNIVGLGASVTMNQVESGDKIVVQAGPGDDIVNATSVPAGLVSVTLDGGGGNDVLRSSGDGTYLGGENDDLLIAGLTNISEVLDGGNGIDTVDTRSWGGVYSINLVTGLTNYSGESFVNIENLITGEGEDTITGTTGANVIRTNGGIDNVSAGDGDDVVEGGAGGDTLDGGSGFNTLDYSSSNAAVTVLLATNSASGGHATGDIFSNFQNVRGSGLDDLLTGNSSANRLDGGAGSDSLDGGVGADILAGGDGNDYYGVDQSGDQVLEAAGGGYDIVFARSSYSLTAGQEIESLGALIESGTSAFEFSGNAFNNRIIGNDGSNSFYGGGGTDIFYGNGGNDYYVVDSADDVVIEAASDGFDIVFVTGGGFSLSSGSEVESIGAYDQAGTIAISLNGNELDNRMVGNNGSNSFDGGSGADLMYGNAGNDYYVVDNVLDKPIEKVGEGYDIVFAKASYTLLAGQEIESLGAFNPGSAAALDLGGNEFANLIVGSAGANRINGGAGADVLYGEGGADIFAFTTSLGAGNVDRLADFSHGVDKIALDHVVFAGLGLGPLGANAFAIGALPGDADDRVIYNPATGNIIFDADGNGVGGAVLFATVGAGTVLSASDFMVI